MVPPRPPQASPSSRKRAAIQPETAAKPKRSASKPTAPLLGGLGFASAIAAAVLVEEGPALKHPDYSKASLQVLTHAVKYRGLEVPTSPQADDLNTALEVHKLALDAVADCKADLDNVQHPIPGHYIVECGLDGDCFYHSLGFLCFHRLPDMWQPPQALGPLAGAHKLLRNLVMDYLEAHGNDRMDPIFFNELASDTVAGYTIERFINLFEDMDLATYCKKHRKLHQFAGLPECVAWARLTGCPLVTKTQDSDPIIFNPDGSMGRGWHSAAAAIQERAWVLFHQPAHYLVLWPAQRIDHDMPFTPREYGVKHWAHFKSRDITARGKEVPFTKLNVFRPCDQ